MLSKILARSPILSHLTTIKARLLLLCFILVTVPIISFGLFSYNILKNDTYEKLQKELDVIAKDWYLITKQYIREKERVLKREEVLVQKRLESITLISRNMLHLAKEQVVGASLDIIPQTLDEKISDFRIGRSGSIFILDENKRFLASKMQAYNGSDFLEHVSPDDKERLIQFLQKVSNLEDEDIRSLHYSWRESAIRPFRPVLGTFTYDTNHRLTIGAFSYYTDFKSRNLEKKLQQELRYLLAKQRIGENGYIWVLNGEGVFILSKDHYYDGNKIIDKKNRKGEYFVRDALQSTRIKPLGHPFSIDYEWKNIGETILRKKLTSIVYIPEWDWYIGVSAYYDDFLQNLQTIKFGILTVCSISILIGSLISYIFGTILIKSIQTMEHVASSAAKGNLNVSMNEDLLSQNDELGKLSRAFQTMIQNLKIKINQLEEEQTRFKDVADNAEEWIWEVDQQSRFLYSSPVGSLMHGFDEHEIIGMQYNSLLHPDIRDEEEIEVLRAMRDRQPFKEQINRYQHKDGTLLWFLSSGVPVIKSGEFAGYRGSITDITQRRKEEEERVTLEKELQQSKKLESLGTLSAGIAHEINTPTQFISSNIEFITESFQDIHEMMNVIDECIESVPENIQKKLKEALNECDWEFLEKELPLALNQAREGLHHVSSIVSAMKQFSHPGTAEKKSVNLNKIIDTTVTVARNEWKYVADIDKKFDNKLPSVSCYANEINQTLLNLIINSTHAIKNSDSFTEKSKGTIVITTSHDVDWAFITISDNGTGIPEEIQEKIFDPFFTTKEVGKGTGQGLYIAHQTIVERHKGKILLQSEPGEGTVFTIQLPIQS